MVQSMQVYQITLWLVRDSVAIQLFLKKNCEPTRSFLTSPFQSFADGILGPALAALPAHFISTASVLLGT